MPYVSIFVCSLKSIRPMAHEDIGLVFRRPIGTYIPCRPCVGCLSRPRSGGISPMVTSMKSTHDTWQVYGSFLLNIGPSIGGGVKGNIRRISSYMWLFAKNTG